MPSKRTLYRTGNSLVVAIPTPYLEISGIVEGDSVIVGIDPQTKSISLTKYIEQLDIIRDCSNTEASHTPPPPPTAPNPDKPQAPLDDTELST